MQWAAPNLSQQPQVAAAAQRRMKRKSDRRQSDEVERTYEKLTLMTQNLKEELKSRTSRT